MFGHHKRKRKRKQLKQERKAFETERKNWEEQQPQRLEQEKMNKQRRMDEILKENEMAGNEARKKARTYGEEVIGRKTEGLTPEQRRIFQGEANAQINSDLYRANQSLLAKHGRQGIGPKSGVAFAQQQALQRNAQDARAQTTRDLEKLNADLALKKLAASFNAEKGEEAQNLLNRQLAKDEAEFEDERNRQRYWENEAKDLFNKRKSSRLLTRV